MNNLIPAIRGSVTVDVLVGDRLTYTHTTPNTLVLEAPKLILGNLIAPGLVSDGDTFINTDSGRPTITPGGLEGPTRRLSVSYLKLGYVEAPAEAEEVVVSPEDQVTGATLTVTKKLTSAELGEYSVQFICSFDVTDDTESYGYFEAALLCPALGTLTNGDDLPDPEVPDSGFNAEDQVMFAHQTHRLVRASVGSTIRYTWTITMQEPA
jgi:hypothetical protein